MTNSLSLSYKLEFWDLLVRYYSVFNRSDSWIVSADTQLIRDRISRETEKSLGQIMVEENLLPESMLDSAHKAEKLASQSKLSTHAMVLVLGDALLSNPIDPWKNIVYRGWESGDDYDPAAMEEIISQFGKAEELRQQMKSSEQIAQLVGERGLKEAWDDYINSNLDPTIFYGSNRSSAFTQFSKGLEELISRFGIERMESVIAASESDDKEVSKSLVQLRMSTVLNNPPGYLQKPTPKESS